MCGIWVNKNAINHDYYLVRDQPQEGQSVLKTQLMIQTCYKWVNM